jgi:hypothetical protein
MPIVKSGHAIRETHPSLNSLYSSHPPFPMFFSAKCATPETKESAMGVVLWALFGFMGLVAGQYLDAFVDGADEEVQKVFEVNKAVQSRVHEVAQLEKRHDLDNSQYQQTGPTRGKEKDDREQKIQPSLSNAVKLETGASLERECIVMDLLDHEKTQGYAMCLASAASAFDVERIYVKAQQLYKESIAVLQELGLSRTVEFRRMVCNLGASFLMADQRSTALVLLHRCVNMFENAKDVQSEEYVLALQNYGLAHGGSPQKRVEILHRAKSLADVLGLQSTNRYKGLLANFERARSEAILAGANAKPKSKGYPDPVKKIQS